MPENPNSLESKEQDKLEAQVWRRLHEISQAMYAAGELDVVLDILLQETAALLSVEAAYVWLWDEERRGNLRCRSGYHRQQEFPLPQQHLRPGEGLAGWAAQTGEVLAATTDGEHQIVRGRDVPEDQVVDSGMVVSLAWQEATEGALVLVNKLTGSFTMADQIVAGNLAASAAIAIHNTRQIIELREENQELLERNEELDAFAHTVAHDLQNPLSLIAGFTDVLQRTDVPFTEEDRERSLEAVVTNVNKMQDIIKELLLLASVRRKDVAIQPLEMREIVTAAQSRLSHLIEESQAEVILPDEWPTALGYAPWVEEVWENYLSNALKYGGSPPQMKLGAEIQDDGMVRFWVRDNGNGLDDEEQRSLFKPISMRNKLRDTNNGHGLGLSIVARIIEKLGGEVSVDTAPNEGSTFSFTLPAAKPEI